VEKTEKLFDKRPCVLQADMIDKMRTNSEDRELADRRL
jgi:hypothetical protein